MNRAVSHSLWLREFNSQNYKISVMFSNLLIYLFWCLAFHLQNEFRISCVYHKYKEPLDSFLLIIKRQYMLQNSFKNFRHFKLYKIWKKWDTYICIPRKPPLVTHQPILYHCKTLIQDEFPKIAGPTVCLLKRARVLRYSTLLFVYFFTEKSTPFSF